MLIIDAHVHIYACFDLNFFVKSAFRNFKSAASAQKLEDFTAVLFIADWSNVSWFEKLIDLSAAKGDTAEISSLQFNLQGTDEEISLWITNRHSQKILIIAGRKIITAENMEVLALCSKDDIPDGQSLEKTIRRIAHFGAIPVIPWAVGKWLGRRGDVLNNLLNMGDRPFFFLCDNGNRPVFWGWPNHFRTALKRKVPIISGSDPLHFSSEAKRAGNFGFTIPGVLTPETPGQDLKELLKNPSVRIERYGSLERFGPFVANQIRMQVFKKKWRRELLK